MVGDILVRDRPPYQISTDPERLQHEVVIGYLARSYWANRRPPQVVIRSLRHSLNFGLYHLPSGAQVGFARLVTDYATYAWLADVFVLEEHRGQGLATWLLDTIVSHPELVGLRRWHLATTDAHSLYHRYGFVPAAADRHMERLDPNV